MNKLERAFWARLQAAQRQMVFRDVWREPITLRLAGRTTYRPDFLTCSPLNLMTFWETKGFMRDDAAVKLKFAAEKFRCFRWVLVLRKHGKWRCIDVTDQGFSRESYFLDWLV